MVGLEDVRELALKHVKIQLLQALVVRKVDFIEQPLIELELCVPEFVHQLLEVDLKLVLLELLQRLLNVVDYLGLPSFRVHLEFVHLQLGTFHLFLVCFLLAVVFVGLLWVPPAQLDYLFIIDARNGRFERLSLPLAFWADGSKRGGL